ncbi:MAG TPA: hypothetical protein VHD62_07115 [Opitutaceae bacterium]|nr:hypothetical protein [Opitutaceae bacterium]
MFRRIFLLVVTAISLARPAPAEPLSKKTDIDFFRDVPSRNLKGLATRSDGRLVAGPTLTEIASPAPADLLWCIAPTNDPAKFLLGTGPDGKIAELTFDSAKTSFTSREVAKLDDPQIFALARLADGSILAGTSPKGALCLIRDGKLVSRALLPVDSIFDLLLLDDATALAATGNPGRIYRIDLKKFATIGLIADKITDTKILADRGIALFGEIRDRNVRRIAALPGGIAAGSSPKGNVYLFPRDGTAASATPKIEPVILQENRDAEVTDLLPQPNGDLYAAIVFSGSTGESRITPPAGRSGSKPDAPDNPPPPAQVEKFGGRSALVWFPANGYPETLASRSGVAFYRVARLGDTLILAGGEQGDLLGYDLKAKLSLSFAGSVSSQLNGLVPLAGAPGKFLLLRNNAPGLALLDFEARGAREAETRRLDLATPSLLGALRFNRLRDLAERDLAVAARVSNGSDDLEGWGPWTPLQLGADSGWRADALRGRYVRLRVRIGDSATATSAAPRNNSAAPLASLEVDRAALYALPQNRRPLLQDFRVLTPNFGVIAAADQPPPASVSLNQLMQGGARDDDSAKRKGNFLSSQVVPSPGAQVVLWTVNDPDNDNFTCTFSIRRDGDAAWTDVAANTRDSYAQFDTAHLPDGVYFTRLVATETAPRPPADRLTQTFETDDLIVDHTPPEILEATAKRNGDNVTITVHGRDQLSLLDGIEVVFNNSVHETVEQPVDGVRDGREETFSLEVPLARVSNATSLEVTLYDAAGNGTARRLTW